jgi:hexosaminidase
MIKKYLFFTLLLLFIFLGASSKNRSTSFKNSHVIKYEKLNLFHNSIDTPSIIPMPRQVTWLPMQCNLSNVVAIYISQDSLYDMALLIQQHLKRVGNIHPRITTNFESIPKNALSIDLSIYMENKNAEAYQLSIATHKIKLASSAIHGIFNGIQTFQQIAEKKLVPTCVINDWPAFSWRGFMIDVGRNFQSIQQIKSQIDVMAAYKLNIFHLHLTEDIAWRLQSKLYPSLISADNMIRNKGSFYTFDEMRDLIQYCKQRYITLVPEIDMPGHSKAFKRALGVDMQSEKGVEICTNLLNELCEELQVPMIHIGGDEVVISNAEFLPKMTQLLLSKNKKVIAWNPGGNLPEGTSLQMWNGKTKSKKNYPSIDSRHLYLNHLDPIDGVVSTFNHKICDVDTGNDFNIGATLCNWPDRNVHHENDLITMNAVYPVMLTFAERCWRGGGWENYATNFGTLGSEKYKSFINFEARLLKHKRTYFQNKPFPYFKQSHLEWSLIGPFDNKGDTRKKWLDEENLNMDSLLSFSNVKLYGGTIWLRHFWDPMIQSHLVNQNDSVTYYAITKIWSNQTESKNFWIGFNNLSRSTATDTPPLNEWDEKNSKIWVNNKLIPAPSWSRAGKKGDSEISLIDENYEIRPPTKILLNRGWNYVLIKAPIASFKAKDGQNPVKWMFSFIPND